MRRVALALWLLGGCSALRPGQEQVAPPGCLQKAADLVWGRYGNSGQTKGFVFLAPDCPDGRFVDPNRGRCVAALWFPDVSYVVAGPGWPESVAHELWHDDRQLRFNDPDSEHLGPGWGWRDTASEAGQAAREACGL